MYVVNGIDLECDTWSVASPWWEHVYYKHAAMEISTIKCTSSDTYLSFPTTPRFTLITGAEPSILESAATAHPQIDRVMMLGPPPVLLLYYAGMMSVLLIMILHTICIRYVLCSTFPKSPSPRSTSDHCSGPPCSVVVLAAPQFRFPDLSFTRGFCYVCASWTLLAV